MKKLPLMIVLLPLFALFSCNSKIFLQKQHLYKLKEMFQEVTVKKQADKIKDYYHKDFILYSNGKEMDYAEFERFHEKIYDTPIQYSVKYDEQSFVENDDKIAGRLWVTTKLPEKEPKEIEVILIVEYKKDKIYRIWQLTYQESESK